MTNPRPYIATPCYSGVTAKYAASLAATLYQLGAMRVPCFVAEPMHNFNVPLARNLYVQMFLETDYDPLVFIDADMGWTWEQFSRMVTSGHDIAVATYPQKTDPFGDPKWVHSNWVGPKVMADGEEKYLPIIHPRSGFIKIKSSGTGFFAIKRAVLEKMIAATPDWKTIIGDTPAHTLFELKSIDGYTHTEDTMFCRVWNDMHSDHPYDCTCDRHIYCDPQGQLEHVGQYVWRGGLCDTLNMIEPAKVELVGAC